jgi:hypothetical protein
MAGRPLDATTNEAAVSLSLPGEPEGRESTLQIDRRPDARIVRSALDEVKAIQTLLSDVYKEAGDGRTLLRELVQNADDAGAERLVFGVLDRGWPQAGNSLLRGPALLVANDGPFPAKDRDALHRALGGSKADDTDKVGRFGVGLKSVFHICEALVYLGADGGILRPGALNPWAGTGDGGDADPIHPDWDGVGDEDLKRLRRVANQLLGKFDGGLLQWVPLRRSEHLDRAQDRQYGLGQVCPTPEQVAAWFGRPASLALLLAQCGHLHSIEADRVADPEELNARTKLARVARPAFRRGGWVGRYDDDLPTPDRAFRGRIESAERTWSVRGIEALGLDRLRLLRSADDWPRDPHWQEGLSVWIPRKALAHAAVTVLRPDNGSAERCGARLRWAVFLPLDDDPNPRPSAVVEAVGSASHLAAWDIVMHGYFWPSQDRRSIPGVTDDDPGAGDNAARVHWNRAVRDELLLPLLPSALANAVSDIPEDVARPLLEAVVASRTITDHVSAVTRRNALLPVLTHGGVRWLSHDTAGTLVVSIPNWTRAPSTVRRLFMEGLNGTTENILFVDNDAPRIGAQFAVWPLDWLARLLECIPPDALRTPEQLAWIDGLVRHVIASHAAGHDERSAVVARWLAERIGESVLPSASDSTIREDLRAAWRGIFNALPIAWLVDAPIASQQAVAELASRGILGEGLLPIPLGRRPDRTSHPEVERLDQALIELGKLLVAGHKGTSQSAQRARLLLAETLLSVREDRPLGEELGKLPLLRALKLPEEKDEPWSVAQLRRYTERRRVFARLGADDGSDSAALEAPSDPKRAAKDLAEAVSDNVWIVDDVVASTAGVPVPTTAAMAAAVLQTDSIHSPAAQRIGLLRRLAQDATNPVIRRAIRTLLTGQRCEPGEEPELYYVRSQDSDRNANRNALDILLRLLGKAWRAVEAELVEPLPHALVEDLHVKTVDAGVLHRLLGECLVGITDWSRLDQSEILHLLQHLYATAADDRARWRAMPLHRGAGGERGSFDDRALRAVGEMRLPPELESEIRLLDPDREVANLYLDIPALDDDGVLRAMLMSRRPQQFAEHIVRALRANGDGRVILPRDSTLRELLHNSSWLPHRDDGTGFAPRQVLVVPRELRSGITPLASAGAVGELRLPEDVASPVWNAAEPVVHEILGRPSRARQIGRLASALNPAKVAEVDGGAYLILPEARRVSLSLIEDALQSPIAGSHHGWEIVRAAAGLLEPDADRQLNDAVLEIARALCAPIPATCQVSILATVATTHPSKDSASGRLFRSLLESFAETDAFFDDVLPHLHLPAQDGQWQPVRLVARSASGVARRHRVLSDLRSILRLDSDDPVHVETSADVTIGAGTADALAAYFKPWADRLPHGAVGAFLGLLGNGKDDALIHLAENWLGPDVSVEGMRLDLVSGDGRDPCATVRVFVSGRVAQGQRVEAVNLLGALVEMDAGSDGDTVFAIDPVRRSSHLGSFWEIRFREVDPRRRTAHELVALMGSTAEWWAVRVLQLDLQRVRAWWSRWGTGSQAQVGPVQASILAHLPLTLHQLDVRECEVLRDALREAQRAQRRREQVPPPQIREAMDSERAALDKLASLIRDNLEHQHFLWSRVQQLMRRFGYREDSVLLELAQNADDALAQAREIASAPLPKAARRLVVRVHVQDGVTTIDVRHYGRPINDTGGAAFPAGRDRQWDQDLYFMMLLNLTGKPGEIPGQTAVTATTGRFGLGFKSIHLVSANPSVVSGFIAFSIAGGLLPFEQPVPDNPDLLPADDHRATRVRLPLRRDMNEQELLANIFRRFVYTRTLLPVFARQLREVIVDGGPFAGLSTFDPQLLDAAAGWSLAATTVEVSGQGQWRMLRFRPADTRADTGTGTAALAVGLKDGKPTSFPADLPFLWNVTPTSEGWGCGYAVNGPFKLDPGRTHVSLDDDVTCRVVDLLGKALGGALVELHDCLLSGSDGTLVGLPTKDDVPVFLATLWKVLASGIDTRDELRRDILLRLHGPDRGLSVWMAARAVVPSDLPPPFAERLPALKSGVRVEAVGDGLDNPHLCRAFAEIADLALLAATHAVVSSKVAERLRPLLSQALRQLDASDLLAELAERWNHVLTPERLHALRPLAADAIWKAIPSGAWHAKLVARAADGTPASLRELLLPRNVGVQHVDADVADELLRAAFAPDRRTLAEAYIVQAEDLALFLQLRVRHQIDARTIATWYAALSADRRPAALTYLLRGRLQQEVLQCLVRPEDRPDWLEVYDEVREMLDGLEEDRWRSQALLAALFPDRFQGEPGPLGPPLLSESTKRSFFERLDEWWNEANVRRTVIESYEAKAWPDWLRRDGIAEGLRSGSHDHWLGLLVLGACRSIGRAEAGHHRSFLESAHSEGWWNVFKTPDDVEAWMNVLRTWQDKATANLTYPRWMSLFPAIYQLSRYLEKYRRLLTSAARRPAELYRVTCLLAPRVDEALTGAGQHFDAPPAPLNMGLHWVLRELVRMGVLDGNHIFPDCWVPSDQVLRFLQPLGLEPPDGRCTNSEKAHAIFEFLASELNTGSPHLHRAFDIPLRHIDSSSDLRRCFGVEE